VVVAEFGRMVCSFPDPSFARNDVNTSLEQTATFFSLKSLEKSRVLEQYALCGRNVKRTTGTESTSISSS
jgi:hypothetical protein